MQTDSFEVRSHVEPSPIKTSGESLVDPALLEGQAEAAKANLVDVDYYQVPGTCSDERRREGVLSGEAVVEPRPAVLGGPTVYGLAIAELTGFFGNTESGGEERLRTVEERLEDTGIVNGGHAKCAANAGLASWMKIITANPSTLVPYVENELGGRFDPIVLAEVIRYADAATKSGRYDDWTEDVLVDVLGDKAAGAIEVLDDVPHEGVTFIRNKVEGMTIDQTALYDSSVLGRGSFDFDDAYADVIEHAMTTGPDAARKKVLAEHAREVIIAAVAAALPNPELYQITLV